MTINGTWKSHSGSTLILTEDNGILSGTYHRSSEPEGVTHKVTGSIDPDDGPSVRPISFSVAWASPEGESYHSVTAYTGQLNAKKDKPFLEVIFMMAGAETPLWRGTGISYDNFDKVG